MKFEPNPKYNTVAVYALVVLVLAMLCNYAMQSMSGLFIYLGRVIGILTPLVYGAVIAFLLNPLLRTVDDRLLVRIAGDNLKPSTRRGFALIITYLVAFICLFAFFRLVLPEILYSISNITQILYGYINELGNWYDIAINWLNELFAENAVAGDNVGAGFDLAGELSNMLLRFIRSIESTLHTLPGHTFNALRNITTGLTTGIINIILGIIVSIYILMDREKLFAQTKKLCTALFSKRVYNLLYDISQDISRIFSGFVIGKVIDSLIMGILCFIGMSILRLEYVALISVIVGVTNVIPYFGPFIGAIPGALLLFIIDPIQALVFLIFILVLQQLDGNVIGPKILGESVGLSPLWIIFSITLFSGIMGILGMFIGVPLFALFYSIVRRITIFLLDRKGESTDTKDYASDVNPLIK